MDQIVVGIPNAVTIPLCVAALLAGPFVVGFLSEMMQASWDFAVELFQVCREKLFYLCHKKSSRK